MIKVNCHYFKLIVSVLFLSFLIISGSGQKRYASKAQLGTAYSGSIQPLKTLVSRNGDCRVLAPANWVISGVSPNGNALDVTRTDKSMYAGYLNVGIQGSKAYHDTAFASPRAFLQTTVSEGGKFKVKWGQPLQDKLGLTVLPFELSDPNDPRQGKGIVFYQVTTVPGDFNGYIIEMYTVQTFKDIWESQGAEAITVALSIRCTAFLRTSRGASSFKRIDANKIESFYNKELGLEYAHDSGTGENYWVNSETDRNENGPQGSGYYLKTGNGLKKLLPGRKD